LYVSKTLNYGVRTDPRRARNTHKPNAKLLFEYFRFTRSHRSQTHTHINIYIQ